MRRFAWVLGSLLGPAHAWAGERPVLWDPRVSPDPATPDEQITYTARWDSCGSLLEPSIQIMERVIQVTQPVDVICGVPPGPFSVSYRLGPFPPGTYRVHVVPCAFYGPDECVPGTLPEDVVFRVVGGVPAATVTALGPSALALLLGGIALTVWRLLGLRIFRSR